ncbi:hypothetical protein L0F63_004260, partial [Massospora cicadina]
EHILQLPSSRFLVKQSTIASGHFHFYPKDKRILETPLLGNGKTKQCLRFSPFGECLDFCLQTDNGVNLAWIQFLPNPSPRFRVDLNRSGRMAWVCSSLRVESDLPWPGLPRLCLSDASQERRFRWVANHPQVYDGLALVDLTIPNSVLGIYFLPSNSVREGYLDFFPDEAPTPITSEDLILFIMLLSISLATFPKNEGGSNASDTTNSWLVARSASTSRTNSFSSAGPTTPSESPVPTRKNSDLLFEKTHVW